MVDNFDVSTKAEGNLKIIYVYIYIYIYIYVYICLLLSNHHRYHCVGLTGMMDSFDVSSKPEGNTMKIHALDNHNPEYDEWLRTRAVHRFDRLKEQRCVYIVYICLYVCMYVCINLYVCMNIYICMYT
jgi:Ca2+/Na+ antiporter